MNINWFKELKTWKKIGLILDILIFISIFLFLLYVFPLVVLFTILTTTILPWEKSSKKSGIIYGLIGVFIGFIIIASSESVLGWLLFPFVYYFEKIMGLQGEQLFVVVGVSPPIYGLIGVLVGHFIGKKKK